MRWVRTIAGEVYGLFVDDGSLALATLGWVAVAWLGLPHIARGWRPAVLVAGLVGVLGQSAWQASRRAQR